MVTEETSSPERSIVTAAERPENRPDKDSEALTPGATRTEVISELCLENG